MTFNFIRRLKPERSKRNFLIAAFDVETKGLDGELQLCQFYHEQWSEPRVYHRIEYFLEYFFSLEPKLLRKTITYIHNIDYDMRYVWDVLKPHLEIYDFECRERSPGKFYEIRVLSKTEKTKNGKPVLITRFRDSMAVFPHSLEKFTKQFAPEFIKLDIGLGRGVEFNRKNPVHIAYAKNDVLGLVKAIQTFDELIYDNFSVHLKGTTSSTAYSAWLRTIDEDLIIGRQAPIVEEFMRKCYNGGLVQINADHGRHYDHTTTLDINSSYPASMRLGVPKGKAVWTPRYKSGFPGFYHVTATIPEDAELPIIASRDGHHLAWARGTFDAYVNSNEMEHAETKGCSFVVHSGFYFPEGLMDCFGDFITICEKLRTKFKGQAAETMVKLIQNSLYGRFGMRPEGRECKVSTDGVPEGFLPVIDEDSGIALGNVYYRNVTREAPYMLPHIAAWITGNSRILIDRMTEAAGRHRVLYRDTDSITIIGSDINPALSAFIGSEYGLLKNEGLKFDTRYHAPKSYTYRDATGTIKAVYKGIPAKLMEPDTPGSSELLERLHNGERVEVTYHSSTSLQASWRLCKKSITRTRSATLVENIYGHDLEKGRFRPRLISAL
jgi:hypothetical protein